MSEKEITYTIRYRPEKPDSNRPEYRHIAIIKEVFINLMELKHELKMTNSQVIQFLIDYFKEHEKRGEKKP
jgi:lipoate-protein ligase A